MSTTRQDFVSDLQQIFTKHPEVYAECIQTSNEMLKLERQSRVFEDFPQLLSNKALQDAKQKYREILLTVARRKPNENLELSSSEIKPLSRLESHLAYLSMRAVLTDEGIVKPHLISLLKWDKYRDQLQPLHLVVGFLATTNHQIQLGLKEIIAQNPTASAMINNYVDHEKNRWAKEAIAHLENNNSYKPYVAASTLGILATGLTALTIYGLYKQNICIDVTQEKLKPEDITSTFTSKR